LDGTIPATTTGQTEQPTTLINASTLNVSAMGSNTMGGGMNKGLGIQTNQTTAATVNASTTTGTQTIAGTETDQQVANANRGGQPPGNRPASDATSSATANQSADGSTTATDSATQNGQTSARPGNDANQENSKTMPTNTGGTVDWTAIIIIAASVLLLGIGILVTKLYKR
jgi:hypothetical protein